MCKCEATFLPLSLRSSVHVGDKSEHVLSAGGITWDRHASEAARPPGSPAPPPALLRYSHPQGAQSRTAAGLWLGSHDSPVLESATAGPDPTGCICWTESTSLHAGTRPAGSGGSHPRGSCGCYRTHGSGAPGLDAHPAPPVLPAQGPPFTSALSRSRVILTNLGQDALLWVHDLPTQMPTMALPPVPGSLRVTLGHGGTVLV